MSPLATFTVPLVLQNHGGEYQVDLTVRDQRTYGTFVWVPSGWTNEQPIFSKKNKRAAEQQSNRLRLRFIVRSLMLPSFAVIFCSPPPSSIAAVSQTRPLMPGSTALAAEFRSSSRLIHLSALMPLSAWLLHVRRHRERLISSRNGRRADREENNA